MSQGHRRGGGREVGYVGKCFFPPQFPREKALTMSIDKYAEIAGKIWLYGWDIIN